MSDILLKAKQHFANFRSPEKLVEIKVPEWETSIWYWPHLSVGERRSIALAAQAGVNMTGGEGRLLLDTHGRQVMEVVVRARDAHGRLLFSESDFAVLSKDVDPTLIERISGAMQDEYLTPEEAEKN